MFTWRTASGSTSISCQMRFNLEARVLETEKVSISARPETRSETGVCHPGIYPKPHAAQRVFDAKHPWLQTSQHCSAKLCITDPNLVFVGKPAALWRPRGHGAAKRNRAWWTAKSRPVCRVIDSLIPLIRGTTAPLKKCSLLNQDTQVLQNAH